MSGLAPDVTSLLRAHGIAGTETAMVTDGYSGARFSAAESSGERYVIKRLRFDDDWIMRLTRDVSYREAEIAASALLSRLPAGVRVPAIGAAHDGDGRAILMRDVSPLLIADDGGVVTAALMDIVLHRMAELHAAFGGDSMDGAGIGWCGMRERHELLRPETGQMLVTEGRDFGLARGWAAFAKIAPPEAVRLASRLQDDPSRFLDLLATLPSTLLHGDLKLANMGIEGDALWLFDWALAARGPSAVDLAWFLAVNSSRLSWKLDETIDRYEARLRAALGVRFGDAQWPVQAHALAVSGLLLYGWGKALDAAAGRPDELRWWCERAAEAARAFGW